MGYFREFKGEGWREGWAKRKERGGCPRACICVCVRSHPVKDRCPRQEQWWSAENPLNRILCAINVYVQMSCIIYFTVEAAQTSFDGVRIHMEFHRAHLHVIAPHCSSPLFGSRARNRYLPGNCCWSNPESKIFCRRKAAIYVFSSSV